MPTAADENANTASGGDTNERVTIPPSQFQVKTEDNPEESSKSDAKSTLPLASQSDGDLNQGSVDRTKVLSDRISEEPATVIDVAEVYRENSVRRRKPSTTLVNGVSQGVLKNAASEEPVAPEETDSSSPTGQ